MITVWRLLRLGAIAVPILSGCGDDVVENAPAKATPVKKEAKKSRRNPEPEGKKEETPPPKVEFQEEDFSETERSRDPFRSFEDLFNERANDPTQPRPAVILEDFAIDDLKLIGIISRIRPAKAMLVDPDGKGHVVHQNDLVGRAERVQSGVGNAEYEINWRVDRIRDADLVLVREDPSNPDVPSATRVISLHPEQEKRK
jgi:type IV pilus assembly protein PilP